MMHFCACAKLRLRVARIGSIILKADFLLVCFLKLCGLCTTGAREDGFVFRAASYRSKGPGLVSLT